ncbi:MULTISPECIES: hypothetical protein [Nitrosomonas]|uniref:hypothetical protein n=1 Tax=Nitrosomonas TaxID=914 RepID=UPI0011873C28|nr:MULTISPECIES: hypothetical protein [Nitrosomonas]UVS61906.1 hypothetical protein NX761_01860 [Nitrosomonas sp. PLL12]
MNNSLPVQVELIPIQDTYFAELSCPSYSGLSNQLAWLGLSALHVYLVIPASILRASAASFATLFA